MRLKDRIKTYNFWVSLASALFLIINIIGQKFNFYVDEGIFNDLFTAICAILVLLGIIVPPKNKELNSNNELLNNNLIEDITLNETGKESDNFSADLNPKEEEAGVEEIQDFATKDDDANSQLEDGNNRLTKSVDDLNGEVPATQNTGILSADNSSEQYLENTDTQCEDTSNEKSNESLPETEDAKTEEETPCVEIVCNSPEESSEVEPSYQSDSSETISQSSNNMAFVNILRREEDKFSGSKEALREILYKEIERLSE